MTDKFANFPTTLDSPMTDGFIITPSNSTVFTQPTRQLWVGGAGNICVVMANKINTNTVLTITNVPQGSKLDLRVNQVLTGNTTATGIVGFY